MILLPDHGAVNNKNPKQGVMKETILLLNPPGKEKYIRDYYCSHISKARYYWAPYDLFVFAGQLKEKYNVIFIDAVLEQYSFNDTICEMKKYFPLKAVIFLSGGVSWNNDSSFFRLFLEQCDDNDDFLIIGNGDLFVTQGKSIMKKASWIDALVINFVHNDLEAFLEGNADTYKNIIYRDENGTIQEPEQQEEKIFSYPPPPYSKLPYERYRLPHSIAPHYAGFLTTYGCPFRCDFCLGGKLPFMKRSMDNIREELQMLHETGIKELWIKDLTFGIPEEHAREFCSLLKDYSFQWICLSRADVLNEEILKLMKKAGCHTIQIGIETASEELLKKHRKDIDLDQIRTVFSICRKYSIRTLAHFILGLPGETEETLRKTRNFALELDPDFASFNIVAPRIGTDLRQEALEKGWVAEPDSDIDNSISFPMIQTPQINSQVVWNWRNKCIRDFYLRPHFVWKRLTNIRSLYELQTLIYDGWDYLKSTLREPMRGGK